MTVTKDKAALAFNPPHLPPPLASLALICLKLIICGRKPRIGADKETITHAYRCAPAYNWLQHETAQSFRCSLLEMPDYSFTQVLLVCSVNVI